MSQPSRVAGAPSEITTWRKQTRKDLIELRLQASARERRIWSRRIGEFLNRLLPNPRGQVLGFCWPYKGEPNVLSVVHRWIEQGGKAALPVVVQPQAPMVFRPWHPAAPMTTGVYEIPIPLDESQLHPDVLLIPLTGFDNSGFRLGYGGGFFDRTVVALEPRPRMIGVGFELSRIASIHPQPHDQPMELIVTESGIFNPCNAPVINPLSGTV
jgi:5-formyltetrahydrofolate cyclo-ligase